MNVLIVFCLRLNWDNAPLNMDRLGDHLAPQKKWGQSDRLMTARVMFALGAMMLWMRLLRMYGGSFSDRLLRSKM
jgi:hypothetical protein